MKRDETTQEEQRDQSEGRQTDENVGVSGCVCGWRAGRVGGTRQTLGMEGWKETFFFFYWMNYRALTSEADSAGIESLEQSITLNGVLENSVPFLLSQFYKFGLSVTRQ